MEPQPPAAIMLRESPDWGRLDRTYLGASERVDWKFGRAPGFIRGLIELWDSTFDVSFFSVRQAVKDISLENFAAVRGAWVVTAEEPDPAPPPELALFSDDDDWFAPDVVEQLRGPAAEFDGVTWTSVRFDGLLRSHDVPPELCSTNNFAVTRRFAARRADWRAAVGGQHADANTTFEDEGFSALHVPLPLSIVNKHPCSITVLKRGLLARPGRDGLVALVDDFNSRGESSEIPPELGWAGEHIAGVRALFAGLKLRGL